MTSKEVKDKQFYNLNKNKNWQEIFSNTSIPDRRQGLKSLWSLRKTSSIYEDEQEKEKLNTFIADYQLYTQELDQYETQSQKQHLYQKYRKAKNRKLNAPHIIEPEKKNNLKIYTRNRSISMSSRKKSNTRQLRLFECMTRLCPRFGRARGSSKRFNPQKSKSSKSQSKRKKTKYNISIPKRHEKRQQQQVRKLSLGNIIPSFKKDHKEQQFDQKSQSTI